MLSTIAFSTFKQQSQEMLLKDKLRKRKILLIVAEKSPKKNIFLNFFLGESANTVLCSHSSHIWGNHRVSPSGMQQISLALEKSPS